MKTAIIGAGIIGRAWAISFARAGHDVAIWSKTPERGEQAVDFVAKALAGLAANGLLNGQSQSEVLSRLNVCTSLEAAVAGAGHVQENTAENVEVKREIFARLDAATPESAVIASSTSGIVPSSFTEHLAHRERCLVVHPLNPPYLVPAVDLVPAPWTAAEVMSQAADFMRQCGQTPIMMKKEDPGFLTIRIQGAMYHEAWRLVASGLAAPEDVDIAVREGLALRWSFIGPFETADLNAPGGIRDFVERYGGQYKALYPDNGRVDWAGALLDYVEAQRREQLPMTGHKARQLWRDKRLMALAAHKAKSAGTGEG